MVETRKQYREWFAAQPWHTRLELAKNPLQCAACCSNPNPQPYDSGDGNPTIRCMNCGA